MGSIMQNFILNPDMYVCSLDRIQDYIRSIIESGADVKGVHMPLRHNRSINTGIPEFCTGKLVFGVYDTALLFAQSLAEELGHDIYVVYHVMHNPTVIKEMGDTWDDILFYFESRLEHLSNITYTFENTTPIDEAGSFVPGSCLENVLMCQALRDIFGPEKFNTTFDMCHALITERIYESIGRAFGDNETFTMKKLFFNNVGMVNNIHLSYAKNFGATASEHGIPHDMLDEKSKAHLIECMELIKQLNYKPYITLEVSELDYTNPINLHKEYSNIWECINGNVTDVFE